MADKRTLVDINLVNNRLIHIGPPISGTDGLRKIDLDNFTSAVASTTAGLQTQITDINALDANQATQILSLSGNSLSQASQIASLSAANTASVIISELTGSFTLLTTTAGLTGSLQSQIDANTALDANQATQIAALSATDFTLTPLTTTSALTGSLQSQINVNTALDANQASQIADISGQVLANTALDANQASQIAAVSANFANFTLLTVTAGLTGSLQSQINVNTALDANQASQIADISGQVLANVALDANQATQIASLSGNSISQATQIAALSAADTASVIISELTGSFTLLTTTAGLTGSLQSQITDINALDANQATQILALSGNSLSQATQISDLSAAQHTIYKLNTIVGDTSSTSFLITHNFNDAYPMVQVYDVATGDQVTATVSSSGVNAIAVTFNTPPTSNEFEVTVLSSIGTPFFIDLTVAEVAGLTGSLQSQINTNTALDANQAVQISALSGSINPHFVALTDAATIATDASLGKSFSVTLGGNRTLGNPTNPDDGKLILYAIKQDGTGNRTLVYDTKFRFGTDVPVPTLTTSANKTDYLGFVYRIGVDKWDALAVAKGY